MVTDAPVVVRIRYAPIRNEGDPIVMAATINLLDVGGKPQMLHFGRAIKDGETEADLEKAVRAGLAEALHDIVVYGEKQ